MSATASSKNGSSDTGSSGTAAAPNPDLYGLPFTCDAFNGMPFTRLGRSGCRVPRVGLMTFKFGYPETGDGAFVPEKQAYRVMDRAVELGVTFWDTANRYNASSGNSERVLGKWFRANPEERRNVIVSTKLFGLMDGRTPNHCRLGRIHIMEAMYASLERLGIDAVDVLFFHLFDPATPLEETLQAVADLKRQDLVRYLGVHNFTSEQVELYDRLAAEGYPEVVSVENIYDVLDGDAVARGPAVREHCARTGKSYIGWGPLFHRLFTERYLDEGSGHGTGVHGGKGHGIGGTASGVGPSDPLYDSGLYEKKMTAANRAKLTALADAAREAGTDMGPLALAWMLTREGMGPVIPAAYTPADVAANAEAARLVLDAAMVERLDRILTA